MRTAVLIRFLQDVLYGVFKSGRRKEEKKMGCGGCCKKKKKKK